MLPGASAGPPQARQRRGLGVGSWTDPDLSLRIYDTTLPLVLAAVNRRAGAGRRSRERRGLARVARPGPDRRLDRDRPAVGLVPGRREPRLEGALRRPIFA